MLQLNEPKRIIAAFFVGIITLFIFTGCSSNNNETSGPSAETNENDDTETLYEGADEVVLEYMKAHYEYNLPVLFELSPPRIQEEYLRGENVFSYFRRTGEDGKPESQVPVEDLINPDAFEEVKAKYNNAEYRENHEDFFLDFSSVEDKLYIVRFDHLFESEGELAYFVKPWKETWNDPQRGGLYREDSSGHLKVKQNNEGEWKVLETTSGQFRKEGINTADRDEVRTKGTVVLEQVKDDPYGF